MPFFRRRKPWEQPGLQETPEPRVNEWAALSRRGWMALAAGGIAAAGGAAVWWRFGPEEAAAEEKSNKTAPRSAFFPAKRNEEFELDRPLTDEAAAARYNNFYEFSTGKRVTPYVKEWDPSDWKIEVAGLVERPATFTMDELGRRFPYEERLYRHRCVETWAMAVPWTGFPLRKLIEHVKPLASAKFVKFVSLDHTKVKGARRTSKSEPFPYTEGLSIAEAANELTLLATGIFGHALPKQHGTPVRLVVPWKYGFKGAKSLVRIEFVERRPATFWTTLGPEEYDFVANVNPKVPHPRWSQATEWDVGTRERRPTLPFNGYGELVAKLYG